VNTDTLPNGGVAWQTDSGRLGIWLARSGVLVVALQGHGARAFAQPILEAYDQIPRPEPVHLFFDLEHLVDYDPPLRTELVLHFFPDRQRIRATHVLLRPHPSGTKMGAAISAFRGTVDIVEDRMQFEALLDERLLSEGVREFSSSSLRNFASSRG
jgi:hypothetical protein